MTNMSSKRTRNVPKNNNTTQIQASISKYFISDSSYPTYFLKKRHATTEVENQHISSRKNMKLHQNLDEPVHSECTLSDSTAKRLQSFSFQKEKEKASIHSSSESPYNISDSSFLNSLESCSTDENITYRPINSCERNLQNSNKGISSNSNSQYTPLEKQYLEFRKEYPDAILLIECGYKYKLFEKDAEIASKLFNIAYFKSHNFMSARILSSRLYFYVQQLVLKGYKVGVIKQAETAALKAAGETKNELFARKLDALYTKSTLIGEEFLTAHSDQLLDSFDSVDANMGSGYLMSISEEPSPNSNQNFNIAFVAIQVCSGDFTYAAFEDSPLRNNLDTHLNHINPGEILLPTVLSQETENLINTLSIERMIRTEKVPQNVFDHSFALNSVSEFYTSKSSDQEALDSPNIKQTILSLPVLVISCLSALVPYLSKFKLERSVTNLKNMRPFSKDEHMILSSTTLKGLDIFRNNLNYTEYGSLLWVLNKTLTKFGERLLKFWIAKPLKDIIILEERLNILTEVIHSESIIFKVVEGILYKLPDLERILCSVFYHKCSCYDFLKLLQAFTKIRMELVSVADKISIEIESPRLKIILSDIPELLKDVELFLSNIDPEAARKGDKSKVFYNTSMYPALEKCKEEISVTEQKLNDLKPEICKVLKLIHFKYATVAGQKYLIEVPNSHLRLVPDSWIKISSTKQVSRFKSPQIIKLSSELEQNKELMKGHSNEAWSAFLNDFGTQFYKHKRVISYLAELDCYLSLAKVAKEENYIRPHIIDSEEQVLHIVQGRHPILTKIMGEENQFVANSITINTLNKCIVVTGPNMGGKSTYVRQTALIAIMAQIGSYVPAESVKLSLFDMICVRMGAEDALAQGKSTFMTEMSETSEILRNVTSKSFVILDELGRGTSTNDGTAIAYATLEFLISQVNCFCMFVTHYPAILELRHLYPVMITPVHMGYILKDDTDDSAIETVTFLYNVVNGMSKKSYGINVAALAGIPNDILLEAQKKSQEMELKTSIQKKINNLMMKIKCLEIIQKSSEGSSKF